MIHAFDGAVGTQPVLVQPMRETIFIEPPEAVEWVSEVRGFSVDQASELLTRLVQGGALAITYPEGEPGSYCWLIQFPNTDRRGDEIGRRFDWRRGLDVRTYRLYPEIRPTREEAMQDLFAALDVKYGLAERQPDKGNDADAFVDGLVEIAYSFQIADRERMRSVAGGLPDDDINFADAMRLLAPIMGQHYPELEAKRALIAGVKDERLTAFGRPDRATHYDTVQASLWGWCEIVPDGRGNYDLRCNHKGLMSASCDIRFSRADVERYRDWLIGSRRPPGATEAVLKPDISSPHPPKPKPTPETRASSAVQTMRKAYKRLVDGREITTATSGKERFNKVRDSEEVKKHIEQAGSERGLSQDTFEREVLRPEWPGKPQIPLANP